MTLWRLAPLSLLLASVNSFLLLLPYPSNLPRLAATTPATTGCGARSYAFAGSRLPLSLASNAARETARAARSTALCRLRATSETIDAAGEVGDDELAGLDGPQRQGRVQPPSGGTHDLDDARAPHGELDALDDLLGLHKTSGSGKGDDSEDGLANLDALLQRDAGISQRQQQQPQQNQQQEQGDGFGALDDLLGLEDSTSRQAAPEVAHGGDSGVLDAVDPYGDFDTPVGNDSLDDLIDAKLPAVAPPTPPISSHPGSDASPTSEAWLDDLLSLEGNSLKATVSGGGGDINNESGVAASSPAVKANFDDDLLDLGTAGDTAAKTPTSSSGEDVAELPADVDDWLNNLIEEDKASSEVAASSAAVKAKFDDDLLNLGTAGDTVAKTPTSLSGEDVAELPADVDDWLNDLLEDKASGAAAESTGAARDRSSSPVSLWPDNPWKSDSSKENKRDSPATAVPGRQSGGGGNDDVISGSNALDGWMSQTKAPRRKVMGRTPAADGFTGAGAGAGRGGGRDVGRGMRTGLEGGKGSALSRGRGQGRGQRRGDLDYDDDTTPRWGDERGNEALGRRSEGNWENDWGDSYANNSGRGGTWEGQGVGGGGWNEHREDGEGWGGRGRGRGREVFDETKMAQKAVTADIVALGRRGMWEDVLRALVGARVRGVPLNDFMYNGAISAVAKSGRWKEALSMMDQMQKDSIPVNEYTYSAAISACGKGGQSSKALDLLDEMVTIGLAPDMVCYGAVLQACADGGQANEALSTMKRMKDDGYTPDKTAYNSVIVACGESGEWEMALQIITDMRAVGYRPDQYSFQFAMKACGSGGRWERAVQLLAEMEEDGLTPELPSYIAVLKTLRDAGQWEKALAIIEEMDEVGIVPDEDCFAIAIEACGEFGRWREACEAMRVMRTYNLAPDQPTYNSVLKACAKGKAWQRALDTMNAMKTSGRQPDQDSWEMLIETCASAGRWETAVGVLSDMFSHEVWYDLATISERFKDCPDQPNRLLAMRMIAQEQIDGASKKRRKLLNIAAAKKMKAKRGNSAPKKPAPKKKRQPRNKPAVSSAYFGVEE